MMEQMKHTPGKWLIAGETVYALDESGTCNRFSAHVQQGFRVNYRRDAIRIDDAEVHANARATGAA